MNGAVAWAEEDGDACHLLSDAPWCDATRTGASVETATATRHAPATPSKIVCVGRNYAAHAKELGNDVPKLPLLFLKPPSALVGPGANIELPAESERVEHEAELALVVGRTLRDADESAARAAVFGFTGANDVTARDLQRADVQFTRAKGFDTFCPIGPRLVAADGLDPSDLFVRARVDGEVRQDGRTSAMMWPAFALVAYISKIMTLLPGDLILTGTPAGVGPMVAGEVVEVDVEGVGVLRNPVVARS